MVQVFAKVIVVRPDGRILVLRRSADDNHRPGEWDFPGGTVEAGESVNQGAARELAEEAGIMVDWQDLQLIYAATAPYENTHDSNTRTLFLIHISEDQAQAAHLSHEHDDMKWQLPTIAAAEHPHPVYGAGLRYALDNQLLS